MLDHTIDTQYQQAQLVGGIPSLIHWNKPFAAKSFRSLAVKLGQNEAPMAAPTLPSIFLLHHIEHRVLSKTAQARSTAKPNIDRHGPNPAAIFY